MKNTPITVEHYLSILNDLVPQGWIPTGEFMTMKFLKDGIKYDLKNADLSKLDIIEDGGFFVIDEDDVEFG